MTSSDVPADDRLEQLLEDHHQRLTDRFAEVADSFGALARSNQAELGDVRDRAERLGRDVHRSLERLAAAVTIAPADPTPVDPAPVDPVPVVPAPVDPVPVVPAPVAPVAVVPARREPAIASVFAAGLAPVGDDVEEEEDASPDAGDAAAVDAGPADVVDADGVDADVVDADVVDADVVDRIVAGVAAHVADLTPVVPGHGAGDDRSERDAARGARLEESVAATRVDLARVERAVAGTAVAAADAAADAVTAASGVFAEELAGVVSGELASLAEIVDDRTRRVWSTARNSSARLERRLDGLEVGLSGRLDIVGGDLTGVRDGLVELAGTVTALAGTVTELAGRDDAVVVDAIDRVSSAVDALTARQARSDALMSGLAVRCEQLADALAARDAQLDTLTAAVAELAASSAARFDALDEALAPPAGAPDVGPAGGRRARPLKVR